MRGNIGHRAAGPSTRQPRTNLFKTVMGGTFQCLAWPPLCM